MATIEIRQDGPYAVQGLAALTDAAGKAIACAGSVKLCRCGGSASKPFCDGTHRRNGFSGARIADGSADKVRSYAGPGITIHDNRSICAHAAHCTAGLDTVFRYGMRPWIDAAAAPVQRIVEAVRRCPSGALTCTIDGAGPADEVSPPAITVTKDGPYAVTGVALPSVAFAKGAPPDRYTLCRCGASKNKPFCDGSHFDAGFEDGA